MQRREQLDRSIDLELGPPPQGSFPPGNPERSFEHRYRYDPSEMTFQGEFVGSCYLLVAIPSPRAEALCDLFSQGFERSCFPRGVKIVDMSLTLEDSIYRTGAGVAVEVPPWLLVREQ